MNYYLQRPQSTARPLLIARRCSLEVASW